MINTTDKTKCCGCKTCSIVCPTSCISFSQDSIGAVYPTIDSIKCINCGKCEAVCPIQQKFVNEIGKCAYAAFSNHRDVRYRGSSGGLFETISKTIIDRGGCVFGSKFDERMKLRGFEATSIEAVRELTKSKYLQSDSSALFPIIRQRILEGREVLFCSTPCQAAALKHYLGRISDSENFFLLDFFCHGVPSQSLFDKCLSLVERRENAHVSSYEFRTKKKHGATPHYYTITFEKAGKKYKKIQLYLKNPFYLGYQKYITLRDSCYHCPYGRGNHVGDITIGDFHDIDAYVKRINRFDGISTVIINTDRGERKWNQVKDQLNTYDVNIHKLFADGIIYSGGTQEPANRTEFIHDMETKSFDFVAAKWFDSKKEWKKKIYYALPKCLRNFIKTATGI